MASPGVAAPQANGVAASSRPDSPASVNSSTKRKRDASDDGNSDADANGRGKPATVANGIHAHRDEKPLIRDFFDVLQRYALLLWSSSTGHLASLPSLGIR